MKNLVFITALALSWSFQLTAQDDAISTLFSKYVDDDKFTSIYVSPKMFQMFAKTDLNNMDAEARQAIQSLKSLRMLVADSNGIALYNEAINKLKTTDYELLMSIKDGNENIRFWVKENPQNKNIVKELLMLVGGDDFVLLSFLGDIDINKLSKLGDNLNIEGIEHLEKLKKN